MASTGTVIIVTLIMAAIMGFAILLLYVTGGLGTTVGEKKAAAASAASYAAARARLQQIGFFAEKVYPPKDPYPWLMFDYRNGRFAYYSHGNFDLFDLGKVIECSLIQDGTVVHKDAVAPAMVGAAVFGLGGAIAGATAMHSDAQVGILAVRVLLDDMRSPSVLFTILSHSVDKNSPVYLNAFQSAQEVYGIFEGVVRYNRQHREQVATAAPGMAFAQAGVRPGSESTDLPGSAFCVRCGAPLPAQAKFCHICGSTVHTISEKTAQQIRKLEQLRDDGILSVQEFEDKKAMLLGH